MTDSTFEEFLRSRMERNLKQLASIESLPPDQQTAWERITHRVFTQQTHLVAAMNLWREFQALKP